jgi:hypothetical protein
MYDGLISSNPTGHEVFIDFLVESLYADDPHIRDALFLGRVDGPLRGWKSGGLAMPGAEKFLASNLTFGMLRYT